MAPSLKNKLIVLAKLATTIILIVLLAELLKLAPSHKWHLIICFTYTGLVLLWTWLANKYKKQVILTEDERKKNIKQNLDCSNSIDWFPIISWTIMASVAMSFWPLLRTKGNLEWDYCMYIAVYIGIMLPFFIAPRRNKYIIQDNVLIVQEYDLFRLTTDLRIPIETINEVYISDIFTLTPRLVIIVDGIERKLRCTTHTSELAIAICQRHK